MKKFYFLIILLLQSCLSLLFAQEGITKHTVLKGETVISIAQKYKVTPNDLYKLNQELANGIKENEVINIPVSLVTKVQKTEAKSEKDTSNSNNDVIIYTVNPGETKFGLAKRFGISISQLENQNPHIVNGLQAGHKLEIRGGKDVYVLKESKNVNQFIDFIIYVVLPQETLYGISKRNGLTVDELTEANKDFLNGVLKSGQTLRIPVKKNNSSNSENSNYHLVQAGETKYGLSKRYGISIEELEAKNPQIIKMLQTGQRIVVSGGVSSNAVSKEEVPKSEPVLAEVPKVEQENVKSKDNPVKVEVPQSTDSGWVDYEVQPKQTLFGLSKMTGMSQDKLIEVNPNLAEGVKIGMIIKIPSDKITTELAAVNKVSESKPVVPDVEINQSKVESIVKNKKEQIGLLKTLNKMEKREVVMLLPFSSEKYEYFIKNQTVSTNQSTEFDFYAGATFAIDSLKRMNVQVDVKTIELEFNKEMKAELVSLKKNKVENSKAILCFSSKGSTEKIGDFASKNNIPFIVNRQEEGSKNYPSTFVSIPSKNDLAQMMLNYIAEKNGNLIVVSDAINAINEEFIFQNFPKARFVKLSSKGVLESESLTNELILNRKNYVVLNTDKTGLILNTTTILLKESKDYQIQLALLQPKEYISGEGLSDMRFKALKMLYPSYSKRNNQEQINRFKIDFIRNYNFEPNPENIKGFDVTFDALVRLFQDKNFEATAKDDSTEQLNYTFHYFKNSDNGYSNKGGYILQYDVDSDTKIAN
jgi:LysM repeat protein